MDILPAEPELIEDIDLSPGALARGIVGSLYRNMALSDDQLVRLESCWEGIFIGVFNQALDQAAEAIQSSDLATAPYARELADKIRGLKYQQEEEAPFGPQEGS